LAAQAAQINAFDKITGAASRAIRNGGALLLVAWH
jgi:hypothetical protein